MITKTIKSGPGAEVTILLDEVAAAYKYGDMVKVYLKSGVAIDIEGSPEAYKQIKDYMESK